MAIKSCEFHMNENVLFHFGLNDLPRPCRIGEMMSLAHACYIRGKELGYENNHIFMEWPPIKYNINKGPANKFFFIKPKNTILPIHFVSSIEELSLSSLTVIDLNKSNSLYDGCPPYSIGERKSYLAYNYLNKYVEENETDPEIIIPSGHTKFTVLIHIRYSYYSQDRNTDLGVIENLIIELRKKFANKILLNCTGDVYKSELKDIFNLNMFDNVYSPKIRNLDEFFDLVNKSNVFIGPSAGVNDIARIFGKPRVILLGNLDIDNGIGFGTKPYWKDIPKRFGDKAYGESSFSWENPDKRIFFKDGEDTQHIVNFIYKYYMQYTN